MLTKYVLHGRFSAGSRQAFVGPITVQLSDHSLYVSGPEEPILRSSLQLSPFHGGMFFGTTSHSQREDALINGYQLALSGNTLGVYEYGGGKDGEFDVFRIKDVRVFGSFGTAGLTIRIDARTWPGFMVCYSTEERSENSYPPMDVTAEFIVPPDQLQAFMGLWFPITHEMFSRFKWNDFHESSPESAP